MGAPRRGRSRSPRRARGGVGLIITEVCAIAYPRGANSVHQLGLSDDSFIPPLQELTSRVQSHGAKIAVQLVHHGKVSRVDIKEGRDILVPSVPEWHGAYDMINDLTPEELGLMAAANGDGGSRLRPMTTDDIAAVTDEFAAAAVRAETAGFDGVEIHAAHGYLLSGFLSRQWNLRDDDYDESEFGLVGDKTWQLNVDFNVHPSDDLGFYVFGSYADREVYQRARQSGGTLSTSELDSWDATFDEKTNSWGAGLDARLNDRMKLKLFGQWTDADGDALIFSPPGGSPDVGFGFDNYDDSELLWFKVRLGWDFNDVVAAGIGYWYERYETSRFGIDGIAPYAPGAVLLAGNDGEYEANVVTLDLRMRF